jgi:hypothetical protein
MVIRDRRFGQWVETAADNEGPWYRHPKRTKRVCINWSAVGPQTVKVTRRFIRQLERAVAQAELQNRRIERAKKK